MTISNDNGSLHDVWQPPQPHNPERNTSGIFCQTVYKTDAKSVLILFFAFLFITVTFFGNTLVVIAVARDRRLRTVSHHVLTASLAVSDFLVGAFIMPIFTFSYWCEYDMAKARISDHAIINFVIYGIVTSLWHLCFISYEKYQFITKNRTTPYILRTQRRTYTLVFLAWFVPFILILIKVTFSYFRYATGDVFFDKIVIAFIFLFVALPMTICLTFFLKILLILKRFWRTTNSRRIFCCERQLSILSSQIFALIVCWLPCIICFLVRLLFRVPAETFRAMFWITFCNSCFNPILYAIVNPLYRSAMKRAICIRRNEVTVIVTMKRPRRIRDRSKKLTNKTTLKESREQFNFIEDKKPSTNRKSD